MASIQITTRVGCSVACLHCPQDLFLTAYRRRSDVLQMSAETFEACIDKVPLEVPIIFSGMCEPWLNSACTRMLLYAHSRGHRIGVFTTLAGMELSDINAMKAVPFAFFQVHLPSDRGNENIKIDHNYLSVLEGLLTSGIQARYHFHGGTMRPEVRSVMQMNGEQVGLRSLYTRAGNLQVANRLQRGRKRGAIRCARNLRSNVLLPNGDVVLCSNDYGMKHVLGNLLTGSYESLFCGEAFQTVERGQRDESLDTLCRFCDNFGSSADWKSRMRNFRYEIDRYLYYLRDIKSVADLRLVARKAAGIIGKRIRPKSRRGPTPNRHVPDPREETARTGAGGGT